MLQWKFTTWLLSQVFLPKYLQSSMLEVTYKESIKILFIDTWMHFSQNPQTWLGINTSTIYS